MTPRSAQESRLGPNELIARIGKGGMDEVWSARDPPRAADAPQMTPEQQAAAEAPRKWQLGGPLDTFKDLKKMNRHENGYPG
jgi:hypothetical protein